MKNNANSKLLILVLSIIASIIAIVISGATPDKVSAASYCGADVCTGSCTRYGNGSCQFVGQSCSFVNCACSTSVGSFTSCGTTYSQTCDRCRVGTYYTQEYRCGYRCVAENPVEGGVYARDPDCRRWRYVCSYVNVAHAIYENCNCVSYPSGCRQNQRSVSCGSFNDDPPAPTCTAQAACTPTCPAGTAPYNTGGASQNVSCSYQTGAVVNNACALNTINKTCWQGAAAPGVTTTIDSGNDTSPLGCVAAPGYVGKEANNKLKVTLSYKESLTSSDPMVALMSWYGPGAPAAMSKVYETGTPRLLANNSFGVMVRNVNGSWSDIYVPGVENGSIVWVKAGTLGSGLRAEVLGITGKKIVGIHDASVTVSGSDINLVFTLQFYNFTSGLSDFDVVPDGLMRIYGVSSVNTAFLPSGGDTMAVAPTLLDSAKSFTIDMTDPTNEKLESAISGATRLNLTWQFSDGGGSGIGRVIGDAAINKAGSTNGPIDDVTAGADDYVLGSGVTGTNLYSGTPHLWRVDSLTTRADVIDIQTNEGGSLDFTAHAFDRACNYSNKVLNIPLGNSWIATKAGIIYSHGGSNLSIIPITGHERFSNDTYWNDPFGFYKDEADITSELFSSAAGTIPDLLHNAQLNATRIVGTLDTNRQEGYWFTRLSQAMDKQVAKGPASKYSLLTYAANLNAAVKATDFVSNGVRCEADKLCVIDVNDNLTISSGFVCDAKVLFLVSGETTINPDVTSQNMSNGCIVLSKGDITFAAGSYKSSGSTYPKFDIVEGFLITDGNINIPMADSSQDIRDGLKINGSILAFDNTTGKSITLGRSLKFLFNTQYPALAVHFDNRYLNFAVSFFGGTDEVFKKEVGYKPL